VGVVGQVRRLARAPLEVGDLLRWSRAVLVQDWSAKLFGRNCGSAVLLSAGIVTTSRRPEAASIRCSRWTPASTVASWSFGLHASLKSS
jgi:hypothetical protein